MAVSTARQRPGAVSPASLSGAQAAAARQQQPTRLTSTSWQAEATLGLREWGEHGRRLGSIGRAVAWWIGDWLQYGNAKFGERYARAARITGYDVQTLMNMVYVASHFAPEQRRESLSWSHHAEVCALPDEDRERWLDLAEQERLSVRCLREEVRRERRRAAEQLACADDAPAQLSASAAAAAHEHVCPQCGSVLSADAQQQQQPTLAAPSA